MALEDAQGRAAGLLGRSGKLHRVAQSSFDAETITSVDAVSDGFGITLVLEELVNGPTIGLLERVVRRSQNSGHQLPAGLQYAPHLWSDGQGTVRAVHGTKEPQCKRRAQDIAHLREAIMLGDLESVTHLPGTKNPADVLTKLKTLTSPEMSIFNDLFFKGRAPEKVFD